MSNDFTLDELELIRDNLHWNECFTVNQELMKLNRKLEDLISNYCEHDFEQTHIEIDMKYCKKCGLQAF